MEKTGNILTSGQEDSAAVRRAEGRYLHQTLNRRVSDSSNCQRAVGVKDISLCYRACVAGIGHSINRPGHIGFRKPACGSTLELRLSSFRFGLISTYDLHAATFWKRREQNYLPTHARRVCFNDVRETWATLIICINYTDHFPRDSRTGEAEAHRCG